MTHHLKLDDLEPMKISHMKDPNVSIQRSWRRALSLLAALLFFSVSSACSSGPECGPGTEEAEGYCVITLRCADGTTARNGECVSLDLVCQPVCDDRVCGDDGCGGSCGACDDEALPFCLDGQCVAECEASCEGKSCGDDGCGGSCGDCSDGDTCAPATGQCVSADWTCAANAYQDGATCDCGCGLPDPDCMASGVQVSGCTNLGATCNAAGECQGGLEPTEWTCSADAYGNGITCDCGCGAPDPDCDEGALPTTGCEQGQTCGAEGTCEACIPDCSGKQCGDDGCGGICGECTEAGSPYCDTDGLCKAACEPKCEDKTCGADGCGGVCGTCPDGQLCELGACAEPTGAQSCQGFCGGAAPSGCGCDPDCRRRGDCCADVVARCGCQPSCDDRACGDDTCGGSCGSCGEGAMCDDAGQCIEDLCDPDPCNSNGTCDPLDGSCQCAGRYGGVACDECADDRVDYPRCTPNQCPLFACSLNGTCDPITGACECDPGFEGTECNACKPGQGTYPDCMP